MTLMWVRQWASAPSASPSMSVASRCWERCPAYGWRPSPRSASTWLTAVTARVTTSFNISTRIVSVWLPARLTSFSWNRALTFPKASGSSMTSSCSAMSARSSFAAAVRPRPWATIADGGGLDDRAGLEDVGQGHVAGLEDEGRGPGRLAVVGLVDPDTAVDAPDDGDQALGLEDAERLPQRRTGHAEPLDELGLVPQQLALHQPALDDEPADLVGDLLWLLPLGARRWAGHVSGSMRSRLSRSGRCATRRPSRQVLLGVVAVALQADAVPSRGNST